MGDYYILTPVSFGLRILELMASVYLVLSVLGKKGSIKKVLIGTILYAISFELLRMKFPQYLTALIAIIGIPYISLVFKIKFWKTTLAFLIVLSAVSILDYIVSFSLLSIFNLNTLQELIDCEKICYLGKFIIDILLFAIAWIVNIINKRRLQKINSDELKLTAMSLVNVVAASLVLLPNTIMIVYCYDKKAIPVWLIVLNICSVISMLIISTYNTKKGFQLFVANQELITQKTYNKTLQNLVDGLRTFKHDYNNTLQTIYGYIQLNNMEGLRVFFDQILDESRAITALDKLNPELFKNPSIFGLITAKYEYARQNNVTIDFEIYGEMEKADMQIYSLTRILGIFLDNAIEASAGSEKKKVNMMVRERKGKVIIEICNTYSEVNLKVEEMNEKGVSSKGENRGLGLYKVKEILKKYPLVTHETKASNCMFMQRLIIDIMKVKV